MFVKLYPENPNPRDVTRIAGILRGDGVIIYPTDGVYAFSCSLASQKAIERLKTIRGKRDDELTIVCDGLSNISEYARVDNVQFRILKRNLPGPFTFIMQASGRIPGQGAREAQDGGGARTRPIPFRWLSCGSSACRW